MQVASIIYHEARVSPLSNYLTLVREKSLILITVFNMNGWGVKKSIAIP